MARYIYEGIARDGAGNIVASATVTVYLAGTTTAATIYSAYSGGTADADSAVATGTDGKFTFYVDETDYATSQEFKVVIAKSGYASITYDYIKIFGINANLGAIGALTSAADKVPYFTGSGTADVMTVTADARTLLDNTVAQGDIIYGSAANTLAQLAKGAANTKLFMNAGATAPEWAAGVKIGTFTRDMEAETADVAYTGVGFKPSVIIFIVFLSSSISVGFDDGTSHYCIGTYGTAPTYLMSATLSIESVEDPEKYQFAAVKTLDADGFTLTWTKASTPASATATGFYLALR